MWLAAISESEFSDGDWDFCDEGDNGEAGAGTDDVEAWLEVSDTDKVWLWWLCAPTEEMSFKLVKLAWAAAWALFWASCADDCALNAASWVASKSTLEAWSCSSIVSTRDFYW